MEAQSGGENSAPRTLALRQCRPRLRGRLRGERGVECWRRRPRAGSTLKISLVLNAVAGPLDAPLRQKKLQQVGARADAHRLGELGDRRRRRLARALQRPTAIRDAFGGARVSGRRRRRSEGGGVVAAGARDRSPQPRSRGRRRAPALGSAADRAGPVAEALTSSTCSAKRSSTAAARAPRARRRLRAAALLPMPRASPLASPQRRVARTRRQLGGASTVERLERRRGGVRRGIRPHKHRPVEAVLRRQGVDITAAEPTALGGVKREGDGSAGGAALARRHAAREVADAGGATAARRHRRSWPGQRSVAGRQGRGRRPHRGASRRMNALTLGHAPEYTRIGARRRAVGRARRRAHPAAPAPAIARCARCGGVEAQRDAADRRREPVRSRERAVAGGALVGLLHRHGGALDLKRRVGGAADRAVGREEGPRIECILVCECASEKVDVVDAVGSEVALELAVLLHPHPAPQMVGARGGAAEAPGAQRAERLLFAVRDQATSSEVNTVLGWAESSRSSHPRSRWDERSGTSGSSQRKSGRTFHRKSKRSPVRAS